jgi:glycosyltransferase involved in cell wall biosynthesis
MPSDIADSDRVRRYTTRLLVGGVHAGGLQRAREDAERRGLRNIRFAGSFPHAQMPGILSVMQIALVTGSPDRPLHYSPVKVREYMAMGLPVIAVRLGELERMLTDGDDAILVDPSSPEELTRAIEGLMDDPEPRKRLGHRARLRVADIGSWDSVLNILVERLGGMGG